MGDNTFKSHNKVGETMSFQTNSSGTFDPQVEFLSGGDRVSWDWGEGSGYTVGNSVSHTYLDSTIKTVTLRTNKLRKLEGFNVKVDNIVGHLDMSGWDNLGGQFRVDDNPSLTGITHTPSSNIFTQYYAHSSGLVGTLDLSMLTGFGGRFESYNNTSLTQVTHTASTVPFITYLLHNCGLTGTHDMSMLTALGGSFSIYTNSTLNDITHTASTENFTFYYAYDCDLTGTHDLSPLEKLGGRLRLHGNTNLTNISFPFTNRTFLNSNASLTGRAIALNSCNLGYVNFLPLSSATMDINGFPGFGASIGLEDNGMTAAEVNHILVDFSEMSNTHNPGGWTGVTLDINGTNDAPDTTSGSYNGIAAINSLTGTPNNWTITIT